MNCPIHATARGLPRPQKKSDMKRAQLFPSDFVWGPQASSLEGEVS